MMRLNPTASVLDFIPTSGLSRVVGKLTEMEWPAPLLRLVIRAYVRWFSVDLADVEVPTHGFRTFNEFFTRRLKPAARAISREARVVSPVDGTLIGYGRIQSGVLQQIKGREYSLQELLSDAADADQYREGCYSTLYLSPRDYHRVHSPVDGSVVGYRYIPGRLFPVNRFGLVRVPRLFTRNERLIVFLETDFGPLIMVMVGAMAVGKITVAFSDLRTNEGCPPHESHFERSITTRRGDEIGCFNMGSTVVLLFQDSQVRFVDWPAQSPVRVGEALAR